MSPGVEGSIAAIAALAGFAAWGARVVWLLAQLASEVKGMRADFVRYEASHQTLVQRVDAHHDRLSSVEHQGRDHERRITTLEGHEE